jgi:hypothetical protein
MIMPRTPDDSAVTDRESPKPDLAEQMKLRLDEEQMGHIRRLAADRHTTLNAAARWFLDRGVQAEKLRSINDVCDDIAANWDRFGERLLALSVEQDLLRALEDRKFAEARALAVQLLRHRADEARKQADKISA